MPDLATKKPAPGRFPNSVARSFDEPRRFHDAALPVYSRSLRKRGAFSPSMLSCWRHIGTDGRGSPSAARAARFLLWTQKKPAPGRLRNPVSSAASMSRGDFTTRRCRCRPDRPVNAVCFHLQTLSCWRRIGTDGRGAPSATRAARFLLWTQKKPAPGRLRNPVSSAASMSRGDFTTRRCRCRPDRPVNAVCFHLQTLSCWRRIGTDGRGAPSATRAARLARTQKKPAPDRLRNPAAPQLRCDTEISWRGAAHADQIAP